MSTFCAITKTPLFAIKTHQELLYSKVQHNLLKGNGILLENYELIKLLTNNFLP